MLERKQQKQIQKRGTCHPKGHYAAQQHRQSCAHSDVHIEWKAGKRRVRESGYVQLASAHQTKYQNGE